MKLKDWLESHIDANLARCILDMRLLDALTKAEVYELHDFLWIKQKRVAKEFEI